MHLFANASAHDWTSFALGVLAGIVFVVAIKRYNKRRGV
jgi:hypothetical protein